jgi:UDP:flavonoid glycosyltransferase YjiC (YdhE family)
MRLFGLQAASIKALWKPQVRHFIRFPRRLIRMAWNTISMVVAGQTEDKMEVAARVAWSGAGINLRKQRPSPRAIREAVKEVLSNPTYRENARRLQADFARYDAPTRAAELLESLVS